MNTSAASYSKIAIWLHWLIAALMITMLFFGEDMIRHATASFYPSLHASLGILILVLSVVRIWWRWTHAAPALPAKMKNWEKQISHITHIAFYVLMIALPLSGLMAFTGEAVKDAYVAGASIFGVFSVPALPDFAGIAGGLHGLGAKLGQVLVILHVLAALKHQFWNKDNLFKRMSPL